MALVSPQKVASGYFRNHLYVTLGLSSLAALLSRVASESAFPWALAAAALSYIGAACWLYEKRVAGVALLLAVAAAALTGSWLGAELPIAASSASSFSDWIIPLRFLQTASSGLLLGVTMAAMLLGHWYLNSPGMELAPLKKLLVAMTMSVVISAAVCGAGLILELERRELSTQDWLFLSLRWAFGLIGVAALTWMARRTLDVPNTQSATGILYVAVIGVFVGETMSLLLSVDSYFPV
jgi:hypothetical protein